MHQYFSSEPIQFQSESRPREKPGSGPGANADQAGQDEARQGQTGQDQARQGQTRPEQARPAQARPDQSRLYVEDKGDDVVGTLSHLGSQLLHVGVNLIQ